MGSATAPPPGGNDNEELQVEIIYRSLGGERGGVLGGVCESPLFDIPLFHKKESLKF